MRNGLFILFAALLATSAAHQQLDLPESVARLAVILAACIPAGALALWVRQIGVPGALRWVAVRLLAAASMIESAPDAWRGYLTEAE